MVESRLIKIPKKRIHKQAINARLAAAVLAFFALVVVIYLFANYKKSAMSDLVTGGVPAMNIVDDHGQSAGEGAVPDMTLFASLDDFKNYLDDGRRDYGGGIFEEQKVAAESAAPANAKPAAVKTAAKKIGDDKIDGADAAKYLSLGLPPESAGDIIQLNGENIYFSPENQFYPPSGIVARPAGETKIFNADDPAALAQVSAIPQDGNFLVINNSLAVFLDNSLAVYDVAGEAVPRELWRARVGDDSRIVAAKPAGGKLYLALRTEIDPANPCPIKPLALREKSYIVDCAAIYHPQSPILVDSVFTILEIGALDGKISQNISFAGNSVNSALLFANGAVYAAWSQELDQISFFTDFLKNKCKSLLPNYLLEKSQNLSACAISRAAKEFELRGLLAGWFDSLSESEQTRISGEILVRLNDYLRDDYRNFEKTGIAKIDLGLFKFGAQTQIAGKIAGAGFMDEAGGNLRVLTVSGAGAEQKMNWFVTGKIDSENSRRTPNNAYILNGGLARLAAAENLDLPAGICAAKFFGERAFVSTCGINNPFYIIGFDSKAIGLQGNIAAPANPAYLYPFEDGNLLAVSKNDRKIKISLIDSSLAAKPQNLSDYNLNDYWADFDANYRAFAQDGQGKRFFLPAARGGYVFSRADEMIKMEKNIGDFAVSRAFFRDGDLYLAGDDGIEVFGGNDLAKIKSIKF